MIDIKRIVRVFVVALAATACAGPAPSGLAPTPDGTGPRVVWDPEETPEAILPFPNDSATVLDPGSLTGRRLNLSTKSLLATEVRLRTKLDRLDGFSLVGPISVPFDAPIDLTTVTDASVLVIDVTPGSPDLGKPVALDLGRGAFPAAFRPRNLFPYDPKSALPDLVFPEDNVVDGKRVEHWEVSTNTLILRALVPLRPKSTYAVVLTNAVKGLDGQPIRSPFAAVNAVPQTEALRPAMVGVPGGVEAVAFAWSFTTQSLTENLVALREGLDGRGVFSWLEGKYPGRLLSVTDLGLEHAAEVPGDPPPGPRNRYMLNPEFLRLLLAPFSSAGFGLEDVRFDHIDYFVYGSMESPDVRSPEGGIWPNLKTGDVDNKAGFVPFTLSIPKETAEHKAPFPVVIYSHGARTSRFELTLVADNLAAQGLAAIGIDAVGHGPFGGDLEAILERQAKDYPPELVATIVGIVAQTVLGSDYDYTSKTTHEIFVDLSKNGLWRTLFVDGRSEDLDGDGVLLSGDGYFVPDAFQVSANAQQTVIDTMTLLRMMQRFDPTKVPAAVESPETATDEALAPSLLAGDFNADGVLDIGGPTNTYVAAGTSLGGIHTSVLMAVEPAITAAAPIVSGGGMSDILVRTTLTGAVEPVLLEAVGPALVGCPDAERDAAKPVSLSWDNRADGCGDKDLVAIVEVGRVQPFPGGTVTLTNPRLLAEDEPLPEAVDESIVAADGGFYVAVAANKGDPLELTFRDTTGAVIGKPMTIEAAHDGLARERNSPRMRRLLQVAQITLDKGDPLAFARHLIREPLEGSTPKNILHITDVGDRTVPFSTMVAWDRAVGLHGLDDKVAYPITDEFILRDALANPGGWDFDDLLGKGGGHGLLPVIKTSAGQSAVRHAPVSKHEFIANTDTKAEFDWGTYFRNQLAVFLASGGKEIRDDLCFEDSSCEDTK